MIFLIEYDRASGTLVLMQPFAETDAVNAQRARIALELNRIQFRMDREIVILARHRRRMYLKLTGVILSR